MRIQKGDRVVSIIDSHTLKNTVTGKQPYAPNGLPKKGQVYYVEDIVEFNPPKKECGIKLLGYPIYDTGDCLDQSNFHSMCFEKLGSTLIKRKIN